MVAQGISVGFFNVQLAQISAGYMSSLLQPLKASEAREDGAELLSPGSLGLEVNTEQTE